LRSFPFSCIKGPSAQENLTIATHPPSSMTSVHPPLPPSSDEDSFQPRAPHPSNVVVFDETNNVDEDVTDFFDTRFKSREDLGRIKTILQEQTAAGEELKQQVVSRAGTLSLIA